MGTDKRCATPGQPPPTHTALCVVYYFVVSLLLTSAQIFHHGPTEAF